jgi:hypothetical protein
MEECIICVRLEDQWQPLPQCQTSGRLWWPWTAIVCVANDAKLFWSQWRMARYYSLGCNGIRPCSSDFLTIDDQNSNPRSQNT